MAPPLSRAIVLIGFMGAGKSTVAPRLAAHLGVESLDSDELLAARLGASVPEYFDRHGETAFREQEEALVLELLDRESPAVIALGGGSLGSERVRAALERHTAVLLDVEPDLAWRRAAGAQRPLARDEREFRRLYARRAELYAAAADAFLPADRLDRALDAVGALEMLARAPRGTRLLWAVAGSSAGPVYLGRGLVRDGFWPLAEGRRYLITDRSVAALHPHAFEPLLGSSAIGPGEGSKTLAAAEALWAEMTAAEVTRADTVVAFGGGVVGDLAGFCAATYQRGVRVVQVPTTLVAMVDSAYGGKTGIDLPSAKNYVGAYHQPAAVIADRDLLATLPPAELAAGYAEVVKTALLAGGPLWERVRGGAAPADDAVILGCARYKLAVVAADERDAGRRQVLNLGHTVGHAIEAVTGYVRYRHGEAVGLGLLAALRLSGLDELRAEVAELLSAQGLPLRLQGADPAAVAAATRADKKRLGADEVPFVLLAAPGEPLIGRPVAGPDLLAAVRELAA